ncbi:MAG: ferric reductase-like transmembrane domain-containing protein [Candidatus Roizmanbacteria bacterium]
MKKIYIIIFASILPFLWLLTQNQVLGDITYTMGNVAGFIGASLLLWQFILGIRQITRKWNVDYSGLLRLHAFLGINGMFFILIHPILEMFVYGQNVLFLFLPKLSNNLDIHITFGRLALLLILGIWITSSFFREKIIYRLWLKIHYVSYFAMFFVFIHAFDIGTFLVTFPFIRAYWFILLGLYVVLVSWRIVLFFQYGKAKYFLSQKESKADGITIYIFTPKNIKLIPKVGQFFYIQTSFFSGAHPFTVMRFDETNGTLTFGIKAVGEYTKQLEGLSIGSAVYIDGPYGVFTSQAQNSDPKVIIAGGIGITPFVELIKRFGGKDTYLFYSNSFFADAINRDEFVKELGNHYHDIISKEQVSNVPVIQGRITLEVLKQYVPEDIQKSAGYYICGSPPFMKGVKVLLKSMNVSESKIFTEEFNY